MSLELAEIKDLGSPFMVCNWFSWMGSVFSLKFVQALRAVLPHTRARTGRSTDSKITIFSCNWVILCLKIPDLQHCLMFTVKSKSEGSAMSFLYPRGLNIAMKICRQWLLCHKSSHSSGLILSRMMLETWSPHNLVLTYRIDRVTPFAFTFWPCFVTRFSYGGIHLLHSHQGGRWG